jgi:H+/Cl- antiporter ClcA
VPDVFYEGLHDSYQKSLRERYIKPFWQKWRGWLVGTWVASVAFTVLSFVVRMKKGILPQLSAFTLFYTMLPLLVLAFGAVAIFFLYGFKAVVDSAIKAKAEGRNPYLAAFGLLVILIIAVVTWWLLTRGQARY